MESFAQSVAGRLLTLAFALPLAVGACVTLHGSDLGILAITGAVFGGIVLAAFGCAMALDDYLKYAIAAIVALPPTFLLYFPLLALADLLPVVRVAMGAVAIALVGFLAKGVLPRSKPHAVKLRRVADPV